MKIYELLDSPDKWVKGSFAEDEHGDSIDSKDQRAIKWCLYGAVKKCYGFESRVFELLYSKIDTSVVDWKDEHTYEDVIASCKELNI